MKLRVAIVGAGISGLALGWFFKKNFADYIDLTIFEAGSRAGGWITTKRENGFLFEEGPRSCRTKGDGIDTLNLVEELGISKSVISPSPHFRKRYIYFQGQLQPLPASCLSFLSSPLMKGNISTFLSEWKKPFIALEDESIGEFTRRRFNDSVSKKLVDPFVSGIFAGDIDRLSLQACFPELHHLEKEHGSLTKALIFKYLSSRVTIEKKMSPFIKKQMLFPIFSFKEGMQTLTDTLYNYQREVIKLSTGVKEIRITTKRGTQELQLVLKEGEPLNVDHVFLAVSARSASPLVLNIDPIASKLMAQQEFATVAVVNLGWNRKVLNQEGFGYLVPSSEKEKVLGMVFDSSSFPCQNQHPYQTRLTAMIGGAHWPDIEDFTPDLCLKIAIDAAKKHLGLLIPPQAYNFFLAKKAIPQYEIGHIARLKQIEHYLSKSSHSKIHLLGNSWRGISLNACIAEAKKIAASFLISLRSPSFL